MTMVDDTTVEAFQRDGAVVVRGLATPDEVVAIEAGIEHVLAHPSDRFKVASRDDDTGSFVEDFCTWQDVPEYEHFIRTSKAASVAAALMQSQTVRLFHDHTLVKEPGTKQRTPWHQDQPYYNVDGRKNCSMWMPVDHVSRASTLEFVSGSHTGGWLMPRTFMDDRAAWFPEGTLEELPDIDGDRAAGTGEFDILGWELEPGDAVFFHMLELHAAAGVDGPNRRRAYSVRFLGDDMVHAPRDWVTSPDFPGLADELPVGAPMDNPRFPMLWPT